MSQAEASPGPFATLTAERPRLMATASVVARLRSLIAEGGMANKWFEALKQQADAIVALSPLTPDWVHDPAESASAPLPLKGAAAPTGPASPLDIARLFVLRVLTLGVVWFATESPKYRDRLKQELLALCAFPNWTGDEFLVTAETTFGAAIGYDWLFAELSERERRQIASAIVEKGLSPGLDEFAAKAHWTFERMNWSLVCNSALMIAMLSLVEFGPASADPIFFQICQASVDHGFSLYEPDGGWIEGPGYWHYATQYAVYLVDCLATALGTDLGLGATPGFGRTGVFRLHVAGPSGKLFNYADSEERHSGGYWLFWLARHYRHPIDAWIERHRGEVHPMDLLWFDPAARDPASGHLAPSRRFCAAEVAMLRGSWSDLSGTYVGIKAGANDSCPHAHYDLGSFVLDADQVRWAIDLGPDDYQLPGYFEVAQRSLYYRTGTLGHNTLVIGGASQPPTARAPIIRSGFRPSFATVTLDLSEAYPACARVLRGVALVGGRHAVIVDEITPKEPISNLVWQMHSRAGIETGGGNATLTSTDAGGAHATLHVAIREPAGCAFAVTSATPGGPSGQDPNSGVHKLIVSFNEVREPLRLTIVLSPDQETCSVLALPAALRRPVDRWGRGLRQ